MYFEIKEQVIVLGIITVLVSLVGCVSNDADRWENVEFEPETAGKQTVPVNTSAAEEKGVEDILYEEKENITDENITDENITDEDITDEKDDLISDEENITKNQPGSKEKPYGEDVIYLSHDPVIIYG